MLVTGVIEGPLPPLPDIPDPAGTGAEVIFHGRVRNQEQGEVITALYYEAYPELANRELRAIGEESVTRFALLDFACHQRTGEVPVGEISLRVVARARHREAALQAVAWAVDQLKRRVPVWKWGVRVSGERFPAGGGQPG